MCIRDRNKGANEKKRMKEGFKCGMMLEFIYGIILFAVCFILARPPVSYTHLDVYKRQPYTICANITYGTFIRLSPLRIYIPITVSI